MTNIDIASPFDGAQGEPQEAIDLALKWLKVLGYGFHPDTRGKDYRPSFSAARTAEYDRDMDRLFEIAFDPYGAAIEAFNHWEGD